MIRGANFSAAEYPAATLLAGFGADVVILEGPAGLSATWPVRKTGADLPLGSFSFCLVGASTGTETVSGAANLMPPYSDMTALAKQSVSYTIYVYYKRRDLDNVFDVSLKSPNFISTP